ncbi:hypothetical protein N658DRAFT_510471, partial [Parathielavia hyrcaniae]
MKAEHDITVHKNPGLPKNFREARQRPNYEDYWLPAMKKQDQSLVDQSVYQMRKRERWMKVLPTKWVLDEKTNPTT